MSIRGRYLQHVMRHLALAAILLLGLVPTVGRWLEAGRETPAIADMAMCTSEGMAWSTPARLFEGDPVPTGSHPGVDCDYCPLLANALPLVLATLLLAPPPASLPAVDPPASPPRDARLAHGLGARGPPRLS